MTMRKGEVSILAAVEQLEAKTVTARTEGLEALRQILGQDRMYYRIDELTDDSFHNILESIFRIVKSEKAKYIRASTEKSQTASGSRLASAASALRVVVESFGNRLKQKTASALLDHIVDTLPDVEGGFCQPIQTDYLKSFTIILSNGARGEHLKHKQWTAYTDFALDYINEGLADLTDTGVPSTATEPDQESRNGISMSLRISQASTSRNLRQVTTNRRDELCLEELLSALKCLSGITNAPLRDRLSHILNVAVLWLERMARLEDIAFDILNHGLIVALSEDVVLATKTFEEVARVIRQRDFWHKKSTSRRENILAFFVLCRSLILSEAHGSPALPKPLLEQLLSMLRHDYERLPDRDRLQLEDIGFSLNTSNSVFSISGIHLVTDGPRAFNVWAALSVMASLMIGSGLKSDVEDNEGVSETLPKRRKLQDPLEDLFRAAVRPGLFGQIAAIQLCIFVIDQKNSLSDLALDQLFQIHLADLEDDYNVASWICVLLAKVVESGGQAAQLSLEFWKKVWSWASRLAASASTSRAACFLLHNMTLCPVLAQILSSKVLCESLFPDGVIGPNALTDAALLLLTNVMTSGLLDTEKTFKHFASHALRWLDNQWTISSIQDRQHNSQISCFATSERLYAFLLSVVGILSDSICSSTNLLTMNAIHKALLVEREKLSFARFLLMNATSTDNHNNSTKVARLAYRPPPNVLTHLRQALAEFLNGKIKSFQSACTEASLERSSLINLEVMEIGFVACVLCHNVGVLVMTNQDWSSLTLSSQSIQELVYTFLTSQSKENFPRAFSKMSHALTSFQLIDFEAQSQKSIAQAGLSTKLVDVLKAHSKLVANPLATDQDFMDSLSSRQSQNNQQPSGPILLDVDRTDFVSSSGDQTIFVRHGFMLTLDTICGRSGSDQGISIGLSTIDTITDLQSANLLAVKDLLIQFLDASDMILTRPDACRLLEKLAQVCLQDTEFERCEAALCLCLRVTSRLVPLWANEQDDDLSSVGYDIYRWFVDIALNKGIASPQVLLSMATLMDKVLRYSPLYAAESLSSARTNMLQILDIAPTGIKYKLKDYLANLFNGYVLSEHSAVFNDIIDKMPSNPDQREGIVLRLYLIANLGAQWHTILRQSMYYIFETAANVPSAIPVAASCIEMICKKLELNSPKRLLSLFAPQVFYTWLEQQGIDSMPYAAFGYDSLVALQIDNQNELVAQLAMRNSVEQIQKIVQSLTTPWDRLLERGFAKVVAYSILTDITIHRSSREVGKTEMSLLQHLGEDAYAKLCRTHFVEAVSTIVLRMSDDRGFEKSQSQESNQEEHTETYRIICAKSSSHTQLPPGQQPSFRAKHLVPILDRLCTRAQETLEAIWTPALLIHIYRSLLADTRLAFGPLHTCAVLRKIRIVLCLAGPSALSGYPLQMLLYALRPFLTQFHSSEDAFGIFWYLLDRGRDYLKQKIPFVTGLSVVIFASLSRFASSSQESTTQESHFASTMSKAQEFRTWLGEYLQNIQPSDAVTVTTPTFSCIVNAAKQITRPGSSAKGTAEGNLLFHLLTDQASDQPLLPNNFFRLTLRSLCDNFKTTPEFQEDILHQDEDVLRIAPVLLSLLKHESWHDRFRIWVSQALGRAYALQGPKLIDLNVPEPTLGTMPLAAKSDIVVEDSYRIIVNILGDLLWNEDGASASAAEATLQSIFSALPSENKTVVLGISVDQHMFDELRFDGLPCPAILSNTSKTESQLVLSDRERDAIAWASQIVQTLCKQLKTDPVLSFLPAMISQVPSTAPAILPHVIHLALYFEYDKEQKIKTALTERFNDVFNTAHQSSKALVRLALDSIFHLRRCALPSESTMAKRNSWLAIDFGAAATSAFRCGMYRMALLLLEIHDSQHKLTSGRSSRRSSSHNELGDVSEILNQIYRHVDDPDFFYGTHEESDLPSIVEKLCHERHGYKALSFQSALFDSNIRTGGINFAFNKGGGTTLSTLNLANLNGLSCSIGSFLASESQENVLEHSLYSLMNLHQWDLAQDRAMSDYGTAVVNALRTLSSASERQHVASAVDQSTLKLAQFFFHNSKQWSEQIRYWTSLAVLAELKETISSQDSEELDAILQKRSRHQPWTEQESFECIEPILLGREATFGTITKNPQARKMMGLTAPQVLLLEVKALRSSLKLGHVHEMSQFCLNRAAYLAELLPVATELGVKVEAAIQYDRANTLWAQHETGASIRILQNLHEKHLPNQAIEVHQAEILTDLGSKISEARLDRPDEIRAKYLVPAIKELGDNRMGSKVGRVYHNFAAFCDSQLREPDNVDEYERVEKIRDRKLQEVLELETMYKTGDSKTRDTVKAHYYKAKTWFKLDDEELQRLKGHRERLVRNCLENYLLSLRACEDYPNDVLRFLALWMEQSASGSANISVNEYLSSVPTYKFAPLMNQLSSRILNEDSKFQHLLSDLMYHICEDHPFHGLYQIFATSKSKGAQKDEVANSRHAAATKLSEKVMRKSTASNFWISIHNSNIQFVRVAQEKIPDKEIKTGSRFLLRKLPQGAKLEQTIHDMHHKIPPPTMKLDIRPDKDYSSIPTIAKFDPQISIAGGVSAPKILTVVATDGSKHKMLLKGGNDDLRQDSIMEQVFEQVSHLLKDHRPTRQRRLGIRTYKVIPLTHNSGIIEFVKDTMPLHDYVLPAHTRYYPKDYKPNRCRKEIADAQSKPLNSRLQAYRNVVANFHPVMRFFFMEHFLDPDEWFQKRLNYSRSTAAISMLGHVLGLGDRHGHNILLDTKTGEVVHIDLGVAFEAGRVLPVPEVVPFRLTRDLVDGMGLSGVEGVFRRCCNFTLEALRRNQEAIMTILDVLRWDPLYSWSVSPLRLARMQENQEQAANPTDPDASVVTSATAVAAVKSAIAISTDETTGRSGTKGTSTDATSLTTSKKKSANTANNNNNNNNNEPSEADRALAVVSKKLGKSLSVEATVNELIRQATDEQNLAVLYCGWAAYA